MEIRLATPGDASQIAAIYAPIVRDTTISFELAPPSVEEMAVRISETLKTHPWLVAIERDRVLGYAYASQHRSRAAYQWSCDVSAYVAEEARGKGVGSELYGALLPRLRAQGFANAFGGIALPNTASIALHEKFGFRHLGTYQRVGFKLGAWHDVGWYQCILNENAAPSRAPSMPKPD